MKSLIEEIVICDTCNGRGRMNIRITGYESEDIICKYCEGSGRLIKTVEIDYKPYKEDIK